MPPIHQLAAAAGLAGSRGPYCIIRSQRAISMILTRSLSSTANPNPPSSTNNSASSTQQQQQHQPPQPQILDERTLLSQLSSLNLKRIICLCPVPLGRGRVSWSGGDSFYPDDETINLNFQSQPRAIQDITQMQPLKVAKYRYGERFAIGVAVSDPYLTHAQPVHLGGDDDGYGDDDELKRQFSAEIVPTFRCDAHNLGSSPVFHTNLPYFRNDFLQQIGHFDIGAIVLAMPMKPTRNPFCTTPNKVELEQERRLDQVRQCLLGVLQNYVSAAEDEVDGDDGEDDGLGDADADDGTGNALSKKRRPSPLGPLNVQGLIDHRLSIADVLSKTDNDCHRGSWDHLSKSLRDIHHEHTMGRVPSSDGQSNYFHGNREHAAHHVFQSVPPEMHAAVALNAMMEKYTSGFQNDLI